MQPNMQKSKDLVKNYLLTCNKENKYNGDERILNRLRFAYLHLTNAEKSELITYINYKCKEIFKLEDRQKEKITGFAAGFGIGGTGSMIATSIFNVVTGGKFSLLNSTLSGGMVGGIIGQEINGNLVRKIASGLKNKLEDRSAIPPDAPPSVLANQEEDETYQNTGLRRR